MESTRKLEQPQSTSEHLNPPSAGSTDRLSIPSPVRITYGVLGATFTGMFLGLSHGSKSAALRFRAENAHRFPTTQKGWYLYHKSKNYHSMLGGIKDGLKMAGKLSFLAGSFFCAEVAVDIARGGNKDFASTTIAGSTVAGGFSAWSKLINSIVVAIWMRFNVIPDRFPLATTARTIRLGLYGGLIFGLAQDFVTYAKGGRLRYVDYLFGKSHDSQQQISTNG